MAAAPLVKSCCFKLSNKKGSMLIGAILFIFCAIFLIVTIGLVAGWEDFDTTFLDDNLSANKNSSVEKLETLRQTFQDEIRGVWKREFISLYCFLPWYALVNLALVYAAKNENKLIILLWIISTLIFIIWTFGLCAVIFAFDSTPNFIAGVAVAQICNFAICLGFILIVFSFYQELVGKTIKEVNEMNNTVLSSEAATAECS